MKETNYSNKWSRNIFFVLASIGASVGLGNLWRFPYMAYENGGGVFFIPYILCLVLVGVPLIMFEIAVGRWGKGSIVKSFYKHDKSTSWIGWLVLINSMIIVFYYAIVLSWSLQYVVFSINLSWGNSTIDFFTNRVLSLTNSPSELGNFNILTLISLLIIWVLVFVIVCKGTNRISKVLIITVPIPFLMLIILAIRAMLLKGGVNGISFLLRPDISKLSNINVWKEAMSQVILSLGLGMGQMVAYSSKRKNDNHTIRSSFQIAGFDFLFSLLAGFAVFGTLGFLAFQSNCQITEINNAQGIFLAFVTYPTAISHLPLAPLWGIMFFLLLVLIGIDSAFAVIEANLSGFEEIFPYSSRPLIALILCLIGFLGGVFFTFGNGLYWLDIVDHWVANYMILSVVALQCIILFRDNSLSKYLLQFNFSTTLYKLLYFWIVIIVPIILFFFVIKGFSIELNESYGGYPLCAILIGGWGSILITLILSIIISKFYNKSQIGSTAKERRDDRSNKNLHQPK